MCSVCSPRPEKNSQTGYIEFKRVLLVEARCSRAFSARTEDGLPGYIASTTRDFGKRVEKVVNLAESHQFLCCSAHSSLILRGSRSERRIRSPSLTTPTTRPCSSTG